MTVRTLLVSPWEMCLLFSPAAILNFQGRVCRLLLGGVGLLGPSSAEIVLRCDVGELQQPGLPGWGWLPSEFLLDPQNIVYLTSSGDLILYGRLRLMLTRENLEVISCGKQVLQELWSLASHCLKNLHIVRTIKVLSGNSILENELLENFNFPAAFLPNHSVDGKWGIFEN